MTDDTPRSPPIPGKPPRKPGSKRGYILLATLVVLVIALWSGYWTVARGMVSDLFTTMRLAAKAEGGEIACTDQDLGGFPFRFELSCKPLAVTGLGGERASFEGFRAVALAYNPWHVIVEADSPAAVETDRLVPGLKAAWTTARASLRLGNSDLDRGDIEIVSPVFSLADDSLSASAVLANLHLRKSPDVAGAADAALRLDELALPGTAAPVDVLANVGLAGGAALLAPHGADVIALLKNEGALTVRELRLASGGVTLSANGSLWLDEAGRLNGTLPLTVAGAAGLPPLLAPFFPQGSNVPTSLAGALAAFGQPTTLNGEPAVAVPLAFAEGTARVGFIPVGTLPPLR